MENVNEMNMVDVLDQVSEATTKLELIKTVLGTTISMVEQKTESTLEQTMFIAQQEVMGDFLHIAMDGVIYAVETLNKLQRNEVQK